MEALSWISFVAFLFCNSGVVGSAVGVGVDLEKEVAKVDEKFLSVAIDSHVVAERWKNFDFTSDRVLSMAKALAPAYLRLGGTAADLLVFKEKGETEDPPPTGTTTKVDPHQPPDPTKCWCAGDRNGTKICEDLKDLYYKKRKNFTMTGRDWIDIAGFSRKVGWKFLFDFNVLRRTPEGRWDGENAREILKFSSGLGYDDVAWELGNEPNSLKHQLDFSLGGYRLGRDFRRLKKLLSSFPMYANSTLVGPDVNHITPVNNKSRSKKLPKSFRYLSKVLHGAGEGVLDAITWHHYYLDGHTATLDDFLDIRPLDQLQRSISDLETFVKGLKLGRGVPFWLGETSSAFGGGAHNLSDRYVSGFLWLDKLGTAALNGYGVVLRQSFYHGCYALIGEDLRPNPDFWVSAIFKRIVGRKVLKVRGHDNLDNRLRLYSHCHADGDGSVVLYGINVSNRRKTILLGENLSASRISHFLLSPIENDLRGRGIALNGKRLELSEETWVPEFRPLKTRPRDRLEIGPYAMAFWAFTDVNATVCQN